MNIKSYLACIFVTLSICPAVAQKHPTVSTATFKNLIGCWQGALNYSGTMIRKPYTTNAQLVVKQIGKSNKFELTHKYSTEPHDDTHDTITISKDGRKLNNQMIKSKRNTSDGSVEIVTEAAGFDRDNNTQATIRQIYTFGKKLYTYKKQVQLKGQTDWQDRQEFNYTRIVCAKK